MARAVGSGSSTAPELRGAGSSLKKLANSKVSDPSGTRRNPAGRKEPSGPTTGASKKNVSPAPPSDTPTASITVPTSAAVSPEIDAVSTIAIV